MKDNNENKNQQNVDQEQTPKKDGFLKRTFKRFGRDLLDIGIGVGIGAVVVTTVFKAREQKAAEGTAPEDQETEMEEDEDVLEVSDE